MRLSGDVRRVTVSALVAVAATMPALFTAAQDSGPLFPSPVAVTHSVVHNEPDGSVWVSDPVTDTYGGSWIVSERADGSRLILDFTRREITEVRPDKGTYTVLGFERLAQLLRDYAALEGPARDAAAKAAGEPELVVVEIGDAAVPRAKALSGSEVMAAARSGVRHFQVRLSADAAAESPVLEAWADGGLRFPERALDVIDDFERDVLSAAAPDPPLSMKAAALARREAGGGVLLMTRRAMVAGRPETGTVEDVATRIEPLPAVPKALLNVPDGFRRVPHPLEMMVAHAEREAELRSLMSVDGEGAR